MVSIMLIIASRQVVPNVVHGEKNTVVYFGVSISLEASAIVGFVRCLCIIVPPLLVLRNLGLNVIDYSF